MLWPDLLVAIDREGRELLSIPSSDSAARHLEARDDHVVVLGNLPRSAATEEAERLRASVDAPGRLLQESFGRVAILTVDGASSVVSDDDIEVVSADPLIVHQGRNLLRVDPVPGP